MVAKEMPANVGRAVNELGGERWNLQRQMPMTEAQLAMQLDAVGGASDRPPAARSWSG
jgi:hypothetical protein